MAKIAYDSRSYIVHCSTVLDVLHIACGNLFENRGMLLTSKSVGILQGNT